VISWFQAFAFKCNSQRSIKGTILQPATRRHVNTLLYFHFAITIAVGFDP
jgi:hypothetical protein